VKMTAETFREVLGRLVEALGTELPTEDLAACRHALLEAAELVRARSERDVGELEPPAAPEMSRGENAAAAPLHPLRAFGEAVILALNRELDRKDQGEAGFNRRRLRAQSPDSRFGSSIHSGTRGSIGPPSGQ
jgi:hypothetical protein